MRAVRSPFHTSPHQARKDQFAGLVLRPGPALATCTPRCPARHRCWLSFPYLPKWGALKLQLLPRPAGGLGSAWPTQSRGFWSAHGALKNICRLEVSMNDSRFVGRIKGVRHIGCDLKYLSVFQRLAGDDVLQGLPFEQ